MNISGSAPVSLFDSVLQAQAMREQMGVSLLKKSQDVMKQQGEAMVQLLEQAGQCASCEHGTKLDARRLRLSGSPAPPATSLLRPHPDQPSQARAELMGQRAHGFCFNRLQMPLAVEIP